MRSAGALTASPFISSVTARPLGPFSPMRTLLTPSTLSPASAAADTSSFSLNSHVQCLTSPGASSLSRESTVCV